MRELSVNEVHHTSGGRPKFLNVISSAVFGAITGGFTGFFTGGPVGAIAGAGTGAYMAAAASLAKEGAYGLVEIVNR